MKTIRCHGLALVSTAAALAASALLAAPPTWAAPADPVLLSNLNPAGALGGWSLGGTTYWVGALVTSATGGTITAATFNMTPNPGNSVAGTSVRVFADNGGVVDFAKPYGVLAYDSSVGGAWTYTGSATVPMGPFWIGMSYTGIDGLSRDILTGSSGANASGSWTFVACPGSPLGSLCVADADYSTAASAAGYDGGIWPAFAIYGVPTGGSGKPSSPVTHLQQVPLPEGGDCKAVDDADLAWDTGLQGGWQPSWAQWANSGRGGPICTRTLVGNGKTWVLE